MTNNYIKLLPGWARRARQKGAPGILLPSNNESFTDKNKAETIVWQSYLFEKISSVISENTWSQIGNTITDFFSTWPALSTLSTTDVIYSDGGTMTVYRFSNVTKTISQLGTLNAGGGGRGGVASLSSTTWAWITDGSKELRTYQISGGTISQVGSSLSLGSTLSRPAICALTSTRVVIVDDDTASGGSNSIRIFDWNGSTWSQVGSSYTTDGSGLIAKVARLDNETFITVNGTDGNINTYKIIGSSISLIHQETLNFCSISLSTISSNTIMWSEACGDTVRISSFNGSTWGFYNNTLSIGGGIQHAITYFDENKVMIVSSSINTIKIYEIPPIYTSNSPGVSLVYTPAITVTPRTYFMIWE